MINQTLLVAFLVAMLAIRQRAQAECHYTPTRFLRMVLDYSGVETARRPLTFPRPTASPNRRRAATSPARLSNLAPIPFPGPTTTCA
jgi:hypothetical protein